MPSIPNELSIAATEVGLCRDRPCRRQRLGREVPVDDDEIAYFTVR